MVLIQEKSNFLARNDLQSRQQMDQEKETSELLRIVERFNGTPVVVLGDLIVDHYIWGKVERISPEAPVVVVQVREENHRPGGAANVANNLVALGANVSMLGAVGDDESGKTLVRMLEKLGMNTEGVLVDPSRPTTLKTRVIAHAQQIVRVDREDTRPLDAKFQEAFGSRLQSALAHTRGVILSDYAKGAVGAHVFGRIKLAYEEGVLGYGTIPVLVDPKAPNFTLYSRSTIVKPNRKEAEEASGMHIRTRADAIVAGRALLDAWNTEMVLITLGEMGMVLVSKVKGADEDVEIDTVARDVFDVSGAGDTVSAVFLLALSVKATPRQAAMLANYAAGIVVGEIGTATVNTTELQNAIQRRGA